MFHWISTGLNQVSCLASPTPWLCVHSTTSWEILLHSKEHHLAWKWHSCAPPQLVTYNLPELGYICLVSVPPQKPNSTIVPTFYTTEWLPSRHFIWVLYKFLNVAWERAVRVLGPSDHYLSFSNTQKLTFITPKKVMIRSGHIKLSIWKYEASFTKD